MRIFVLGLAAGVAACTPALAQLPFPGAQRFPLEQHFTGSTSDEAVGTEVAGILYNGRTFTSVPDSSCPQSEPCTVRVEAVKRWVDAQQGEHLSMVTAAEMPDKTSFHAAGALIGAVDLVWAGYGWEINAGSPIVAVSGSFGKGPQSAIFDAGPLGMGFVLMPGFNQQGDVVQRWQLYLASSKTHEFKQVLDLPLTADSSGDCGTSGVCRKGDFTTHIDILPLKDGIAIEAIKTEFGGAKTAHTYRCGNPADIVCR